MKNYFEILSVESLWKVVDYQLKLLVRKEYGSGLLVKVYSKENIIFSAKYGKLVNYENEFFPVGSISKVKMLDHLLELAQDNKIYFDDPVSLYVPELAGKPLGEKKLYMFLNHTSGLSRDGLWGNGTTELYPNDGEVETYLLENPLIRDGGWAYSNLGYQVLKMVIERVSSNAYLANEQGTDKTNITELYVKDEDKRVLTQIQHEVNTETEASIGWLTMLEEQYQTLQKVMDKGNELLFKEMFFVSRTPEPDWILGLSQWKVGEETIIGHQGDGYGYAAKVATTKDQSYGISLFSNTMQFPVHGVTNMLFSAKSIHDATLTNENHQDVSMYGGRSLNIVVVRTSKYLVIFRENAFTPFQNILVAERSEGTNRYTVTQGGSTAFYGETVSFNAQTMWIGPYEFNLVEQL